MTPPRLIILFTWCVLFLNHQFIVKAAGKWEVKKLTGESYSQPRFAISLQDHTAAFVSSAYCVNTQDDDSGAPIGYSRSLCQGCPSCAWKLREGFTTEAEWRTAVSSEMARLQQGDGHIQQQELVGTWIAEAPFSRINFTDTLIDDLSSSLDVSFDKALIVSAEAEEDRGYFVVSGTPSSMDGMWSAGFESLTPIPPSLKVDPMLEEAALMEASATTTADATLSLHVQIFERPTTSIYTNNTTPASTHHRSAAQFLSTAWTSMIATRLGHGKAEVMADGDHHVTVRGLTSTEQLYRVALDIAAHGEVHWVAPQGRLSSSNYFASQVVQSGSWYMPGGDEDEAPSRDKQDTIDSKYSPFSVLGLTGKDQVVGVADTGLDWNSGYFYDENNEGPRFTWSDSDRRVERLADNFEVWESKKHRKIRQYVAYMNGEEDEEEGHGTHISGSIAGAPPNGDIANVHYRGVAPDAKIALFDRYSKYEEANNRDHMPANLGRYVFPHAHRVGARVYVASFNYGGQNPAYSAMAKWLDQYCHLHQDFIVLVSAGSIVPRDGLGRQQTISSPAEAKNAVTVGSHFNPIVAVVDQVAPENAADFIGVDKNSANGPTHDGRIKPDVVGPGSSVCSAASSPTGPPGHCNAVYKDGTSSANAIVAGGTVLARQYFTDGYYPTGVKTTKKKFKPMGALLKAVLVNSARAVGGHGSEEGEVVTVPNMAQGWGGVNLASTLVTPSSPEGLQLKVFGKWSKGCSACPRILPSKVQQYTLMTTADTHGLPLKVTLVWYDPPASSPSRTVLVNDLDLTVSENGPTGQADTTRFYANGKRGYDKLNTVEHIQIPDPKPGTKYTVKVRATRIGVGKHQNYAMVISGPFDRSNVINVRS